MPYGEERWNCRGGHQQVFRYSKSHKDRMGHCNQLPKPGDLCIRFADAGDCFHDYIVMRPNGKGKYVRAFEFGAYVFGTALCKLDDRTFHLAMAGEPVDLDSVIPAAKKPKRAKKKKK